MSEREKQQWRIMERRSFDPRRWFHYGYDDPDEEVGRPGVLKMWVYKQIDSALWAVGFFDPQGSWEEESQHASRSQAAGRVHWLNGGQPG